jgi:signal transduction histidine kinase
VIEVVNRRRPDDRSAPDDGNGIIGMRERAASTGGRFEVEADRRTFRVRAELPGDGSSR